MPQTMSSRTNSSDDHLDLQQGGDLCNKNKPSVRHQMPWRLSGNTHQRLVECEILREQAVVPPCLAARQPVQSAA